MKWCRRGSPGPNGRRALDRSELIFSCSSDDGGGRFATQSLPSFSLDGHMVGPTFPGLDSEARRLEPYAPAQQVGQSRFVILGGMFRVLETSMVIDVERNICLPASHE